MKKTVLLLQMMEHPEDYSAQQWKEILSDKECLELYTLSCKVRGIIAAKKNNDRLTDGDISEEWEKIQKEYYYIINNIHNIMNNYHSPKDLNFVG